MFYLWDHFLHCDVLVIYRVGRHTSVYLLRDITNNAFCLYAALSSLPLLSRLKYVLVYITISEY